MLEKHVCHNKSPVQQKFYLSRYPDFSITDLGNLYSQADYKPAISKHHTVPILKNMFLLDVLIWKYTVHSTAQYVRLGTNTQICPTSLFL